MDEAGLPQYRSVSDVSTSLTMISQRSLSYSGQGVGGYGTHCGNIAGGKPDHGLCQSGCGCKDVPDRYGSLGAFGGLVTSILDHEQAPAQELAALYHER